MDELPNVCDFQEGFEPESPYDNGWTLNIEFIDPNEDSEVSEKEARTLLHELFSEANGDYSDIREYLERIEYQYEGDMESYDLAQSVADELGITDFEPEE